ncbi:helix-turn-helix transcriptional regulator [Marivibrio halodurans]|uniref:Helix-turn-helix transcriptional regulator n=1 Tax=Marivibrio halodurans TaxID=2039722 RepID=A0A8J7V2Y4_9PROT|nr:helix-turn-helix transcriptional regulator [Marivibrio halodurans]MBP5856249.1 helix-turn-helix transcriptional regulator [Marivibrio halodurans]
MRNKRYDQAIADSAFGSISRLAEHLGLSYRNVESYAKDGRRPVDRKGIVKYDIAAICEALDCSLEDLFPEEQIDRPYRVRESYADGYGQRKKKTPRKSAGADKPKAPPRRKAEKIRKREADLAELRGYFESGLLPSRIFVDAEDAPEGLNPRAVGLWLSPKPPKIPAKHLAYVLKRCREMADQNG